MIDHVTEHWGASPNDVIYLDHAATTPVDPRVLDVMIPFFTNSYGNPSSVHALGRDARAGIDWARGTIAAILGCRSREIIFTGGATEADNLAIKGVAWHYRRENPDTTGHIITTSIEHHAVLHTVDALADAGFDVTIIPVDHNGIVDPADVEDAIRTDTCVISVIYANNEIGTIQPIREIGEIARSRSIPFHTDAVQAAGALSLDVNDLGVDLLSLSAHKFYAPKGVGLLFVREGVRFNPLLHGGGQELTRRAGTENVPGIVGMAAGLQLAIDEHDQRTGHARDLTTRLSEGLLGRVRDCQINGHPVRRLPNNVNVAFAGVDGESLLLDLDLQGVAVSSGSACASGSNQPSHVLRAIGLPDELAEGSLRLTVGKDTTRAEIDRAIEIIAASVERVRSLIAAS